MALPGAYPNNISDPSISFNSRKELCTIHPKNCIVVICGPDTKTEEMLSKAAAAAAMSACAWRCGESVSQDVAMRVVSYLARHEVHPGQSLHGGHLHPLLLPTATGAHSELPHQPPPPPVRRSLVVTTNGCCWAAVCARAYRQDAVLCRGACVCVLLR